MSKNLPCQAFSGVVHRCRSTRMLSLRRPPRSSKRTPVELNSSATQPAPTPAISRPPDSRSSVASSRAISTGGLSAIMLTLVPSSTRSVTAATYDSAIHGSGIGSYGCGLSSGVTTRSLNQTEWKPTRSASSAARRTLASSAGPIFTPTINRLSCCPSGVTKLPDG